MLAFREPALYGVGTLGNKDAIKDAIKRCFKALDDEILEQAQTSDVKECQFGGTTALMILAFGQVCKQLPGGDDTVCICVVLAT